MSFPDGFLWGVAAAAYQIEGTAGIENGGLSIWDAFARRPGAVFDQHDGSTACDHFHRYPEDAVLIADLGARAYRLSVSWPRVIPGGQGKPSEAGLDFYDRLVDALLERSVEPWVTLFHWDFPLALFHRGGWLNRNSAEWFGEYARAVVSRLGDRVRHWMTHNEPQVFIGLGHGSGEHAPGIRYDRRDMLRAAHHALLAHGRAAEVIRECSAQTPQVGWAPHGTIPYPATSSESDIAAARRAFETVPPDGSWTFSTPWFSDPVVRGEYPESGLAHFGNEMPPGFENDLPTIAQPLDFFGVNIYQGTPISAGPDGQPQMQKRPAGHPITMCRWPVAPKVLYWGPLLLHERYGRPIYITENGCASMDWVHTDGHVHDAGRIDFTTRYLLELRRALEEGVDVRGYFHWSIFDNFEWAEGYRMRFGLIHVDFDTLERIPKDSYSWYQQVILSNGACLPQKVAELR